MLGQDMPFGSHEAFFWLGVSFPEAWRLDTSRDLVYLHCPPLLTPEHLCTDCSVS